MEGVLILSLEYFLEQQVLENKILWPMCLILNSGLLRHGSIPPLLICFTPFVFSRQFKRYYVDHVYIAFLLPLS
jgi:hypothetical protein